MKKLTFLLTLVFVLGMAYSANAITIRALGGLGFTAVDVDVYDGSKFNYGFDGQLLFDILPILSVGVDGGYLHAYKTKISGISASAEYVNVNGMAELSLFDLLVIQGGAGVYFHAGNNGNNPFGVMLGAGVQIPIIPSLLSIPILARMDVIFDDKTVTPFRLMAGIALSF